MSSPCIAACADEGHPGHLAPDLVPTIRLFFPASAIDAALASLRGPVTREESIVMAAAGAASASMKTGLPIVENR